MKGASLYGYTRLYGGVPGGQAEYLRAQQAQYSLIKIPDGGVSDDRFLFLSDVLPTAWQAVTYADTPKGGTLAVYGLGPIGQMCVRVARHKGVERVLAADYVPERLRLAEQWGAEPLDLTDVDDATQAVVERTSDRGADAVIDAVGMEAEGSLAARALQFVKLKPDRHTALHGSMRSVRRGGTLSIIGVYVGPDPLFPLGELFDRQVQVRMGQANVKRWTPEIMPLLTDGDPLGTEQFTTHRLPLAEAPQAYSMFQKKEDGAIKVVLTPCAERRRVRLRRGRRARRGPSPGRPRARGSRAGRPR